MADPDRTRIRRLLETADVDTLKAHAAFDAFGIAPLSAVLVDRFDGFDATTKISIISEHPRSELVPSGIAHYAQARSYRSAEQLGQSVVLPLAPFFTADDLQAALVAAADNGQIWDASGTPEILEQLFDHTQLLLHASRPHWEAFLGALRGRQQQLYSGLRDRLDANH